MFCFAKCNYYLCVRLWSLQLSSDRLSDQKLAVNKQSHSFLLWWSHAYRQYLHPSRGKAHSSRSLWRGSCGWEALCLPNFLSVNWLYTHLNNLSDSAWEWETDSCAGISLHQQHCCTVGACVCILRRHSNLALFCSVLVGPVDSAGALITGSLCPLYPQKRMASEPPSALMWPRSTTHVGHELT